MRVITAVLRSQLCDIQSQFEAAIKSRARLGVLQAQRKLALWQELDSKIDRIIERSMVRRA